MTNMGGSPLDREIQRQKEEKQRLTTAASPSPARQYPPGLVSVIEDFLGRGIPPEGEFWLAGTPSPRDRRFPLFPRRLRPNGWVLFNNNGDGMGDSGPWMILTTDGLLRIRQRGGGWTPIPDGFSDSALRGPKLDLQSGSLEAHVLTRLAELVRGLR